jgi:hypothetical protein
MSLLTRLGPEGTLPAIEGHDIPRNRLEQAA